MICQQQKHLAIPAVVTYLLHLIWRAQWGRHLLSVSPEDLHSAIVVLGHRQCARDGLCFLCTGWVTLWWLVGESKCRKDKYIQELEILLHLITILLYIKLWLEKGFFNLWLMNVSCNNYENSYCHETYWLSDIQLKCLNHAKTFIHDCQYASQSMMTVMIFQHSKIANFSQKSLINDEFYASGAKTTAFY